MKPASLNSYQTHLSTVMGGLKDKLKTILDYIPADAPLVYLDPPIHLNVGDLLINLGTERFLADNNRKIDYRFSLLDYKRFQHLIRKDHVLVFHGGGNLGDVWPNHEPLRQALLRAFPDNKAVVLPQTVHVKNLDRVAEFSGAYREHSDCIIFTRDARSHALVRDQFKVRTEMMPDLAHHLWDKADFPAFAPSSGELVLLRKDVEAGERDPSIAYVDWDDLVTRGQYVRHKFLSYSMAFNPLEGLQPGLLNAWYDERDAIIRHCVAKFKGYASVSTDRLHGIILSLLLGKVVNMRDNNYGKLSTYANAWLDGLPAVQGEVKG